MRVHSYLLWIWISSICATIHFLLWHDNMHLCAIATLTFSIDYLCFSSEKQKLLVAPKYDFMSNLVVHLCYNTDVFWCHLYYLISQGNEALWWPNVNIRPEQASSNVWDIDYKLASKNKTKEINAYQKSNGILKTYETYSGSLKPWNYICPLNLRVPL